MTAGTEPLTERPAWKALKAHYNEIRNVHLRKLFSRPGRRSAAPYRQPS
jgi:glucose-6-phosphate isomerase